ncbi:hypothetical protein CDAR_608061 [Caerostris darwini]|uniref:Uncharacterized protein n=1 Tax=Caerostris darwini TaxID=1538125 RepID=A0AAV4PYR0_9ARAC|nr:hypothetical protein CDAR_608061 [Caerostris darwini]
MTAFDPYFTFLPGYPASLKPWNPKPGIINNPHPKEAARKPFFPTKQSAYSMVHIVAGTFTRHADLSGHRDPIIRSGDIRLSGETGNLSFRLNPGM